VALAVGRILQRLVQGMRPVNLATVAIVVPVLAADALSATLVPARRQTGRTSERTTSGVIVGRR
jgi:hypothetical protein